jgi:AraC family transcriptional regulator
VVDVGPFIVTDAWFPADLVLAPHLHDRTTFAVILDGSFDLRFSSNSFECSPSTVFTEPLGEKHGNRMGPQGTRVLVMQPDHRQVELFRPCRHMFDRVTHFRHAGISGLARRLSYELRSSDGTSRLAMQGLGLEMLAAAARLDVSGPSSAPAWLARAEEKLRAEFLSGIDLGEVAAAAGVHPVHLARTFRQYYRESIGSFVRRLRLDWTMTQLATSRRSIASIALAAGFADQSHFTRAFKCYAGVTPARFRKATC